MPRPGRYWIPLDVDYWDHPQIVDAGEPAACLYLRLLAHARVNGHDGWIPVRQPRAWYDDWRERLDALVRVGLVTVGERNIDVADWDKWHQPVAERIAREERKRAADRDRMRRKRRGIALEVEEQEPDLRAEQRRATNARDSHATSHATHDQNGRELTGIPALLQMIREDEEQERAKKQGNPY